MKNVSLSTLSLMHHIKTVASSTVLDRRVVDRSRVLRALKYPGTRVLCITEAQAPQSSWYPATSRRLFEAQVTLLLLLVALGTHGVVVVVVVRATWCVGHSCVSGVLISPLVTLATS